MATAATVATAPSQEILIADDDRDAPHVLPLAIVPLETPALLRARMIKNSALESVVELFTDCATGSGQIDIESLPNELGWSRDDPHPDHVVMRKLGLLPSFDVYSLRTTLRRHGIIVDEAKHLKLSAAKNAELTKYMKGFTRPLIAHIYGEESVDAEGFEQLLSLFREPDARKAKARLSMLSAKLEIPIIQVPRFLEEYGDMFLSLSYYREALDRLTPALNSFRGSLTEISRHHQLNRDTKTMEACKTVYVALAKALETVRTRLTHFDEITNDLWTDISAEHFRKGRRAIIQSHATIGGVLCALTVKMNAWEHTFPIADAGGPIRRAHFIANDMRRGLEKVQHLESAAAALASVA